MKLYGNIDGSNVGKVMGTNLQDYGEIVNALGSVSGATSIDLNLGNIVSATATGAIQWTVSNPVASGKCCSFTLILTNGGAGTQTWMTGIKWPGGTGPTLVASGVDVLSFFTIDGGTTWRGVLAQADTKAPA